ncbi:MAG: hypothetical protein H7Y22_06325 [Gemmatimonadaceae bacterium]|nr:hypothetical protein [Gloeobacterales cyanobacterium ES-bin-141]
MASKKIGPPPQRTITSAVAVADFLDIQVPASASAREVAEVIEKRFDELKKEIVALRLGNRAICEKHSETLNILNEVRQEVAEHGLDLRSMPIKVDVCKRTECNAKWSLLSMQHRAGVA